MQCVAVVQAGLALMFSMRLRSERRNLLVALGVSTIFVLAMMSLIWSSSFRLLHFRSQNDMLGTLGLRMRAEKRLPLATIALAAITLVVPPAAFSQNCALCYTQAASAAARLIQAPRSGILVRMIPSMFMAVGITTLAYRKRDQFRSDEGPDE
jgi:ABC-type transport system involved in multi-copper enzyme maturation permease subunit